MPARALCSLSAVLTLAALSVAGCAQPDATATRHAEATVVAIRGADGQLVRATASTRGARTLSQRIEDNARALLSDK